MQAALIGRRVRELRQQKGYTQQRLADDAQIAISTLRKIESAAITEPGYFTILSILRALDASAEDLLA